MSAPRQPGEVPASALPERGHFFANADEARTFARELAEQRGLLLVDIVAAGERAEQ